MSKSDSRFKCAIPDQMTGLRCLLKHVNRICRDEEKAQRRREADSASLLMVQLKTIDLLITDMLGAFDAATEKGEFAMLRIQSLTLEQFYEEYPDAARIDTDTGLEIPGVH